MTQPPPAAPGSPAERSSDRSRLARVALEAALSAPGVIRGEAGVGAPRVTADASELLVGVTAIAQGDGRYAVDLRLVAQVVPLHPLADAVRAQVRDAASRVGLAGVLGSVNVEFADLFTAETAASTSAAPSATSAAPGHDVPAPVGVHNPQRSPIQGDS